MKKMELNHFPLLVLFISSEFSIAMPYDGMSLVERQTAMAAGFMFWDSDNVALSASPAAATSGVNIGNIINCAYPGKNFKGRNDFC